MQVLDFTSPNDKISTFHNETGDYIRGFLISTKLNKNKWKVRRDTINEKVQQFLDKDFSVIPHRIGNTALLDGHVIGTKDEVFKAYSDNSYGKIAKILGPFQYNDGTDDVWFEHITRLTNNKIASALFKHGINTLVPFATSPHIFGVEGNDEDGWIDWQAAGIVLVSNPAFGKQSVITKSCKGEQSKCTDALAQNRIASEELASNLIASYSSIVSSSENKQTLDMSNDTNAPDVGKNLTDNTLQVQETKTDPTITKTNVPEVNTQDITKDTNQNQTDRVKELEAKVAQMENKEKTQILQSMFAVVSDEKEREKAIKDIAESNSLNTIEYIKAIVDQLAPLYKKQGESELSKQLKQKEEIAKAEQLKLSKNKVASYKFSLPGEPEEPAKETTEEATAQNKVASKKIGEIAELQSLLKSWGGSI